MRALPVFAAAIIAPSCLYAQEVDVTAGPGEPNGVDRLCRIEIADPIANALCLSQALPGEDVVRASLEQGYGLSLVRSEPYVSEQTSILSIERAAVVRFWRYEFVVDTGQRPVRPAPIFPSEAQRRPYAASCVARFDVASDGRPTNSCIECAADNYRKEFEASVEHALSYWLYDAAAGDPEAPERKNLLVELPFEIDGAETPPTPSAACSIEGVAQ